MYIAFIDRIGYFITNELFNSIHRYSKALTKFIPRFEHFVIFFVEFI